MRNGLSVLLLSAAMIGLWAGCSGAARYQKGRFENARVVYEVPDPGAGWERRQVDGADLVFWNERLSAFILVNSTCDEYRDAPVSALAGHLYIGYIEKKEVLKKEEATIDGRHGIYMEVQGEVDGYPVKFASYTLAKNYCTYDLVYSAPVKVFDQGLPMLHALASKFKVIGRKD